jgi:Tat protein secretion system quality control protein TatD with DNase activity
MNGWFDSHCHVQEEYLGGGEGGDGERDLSLVLARARSAGVDRLVCIGTGRSTSERWPSCWPVSSVTASWSQ